MGSKGFAHIAAMIVLGLLIAGGAAYYALTNSGPAFKTFSNPNGGYSFEYPPAWNAAINRYNDKNSLFGPNADDGAGLGGVEIFKNVPSIDGFLAGVEAQYTDRTDITVDGVPGIRARHKGIPASGETVVLLKNGDIYNIYVNSEDGQEIESFDRVVSTFKFLPAPSITVTSPKGGETWTTGTTHAISWTTANIPATDKISVTIRRIPPPPLQTEGQEFDPIIFINLENTGSAEWTVSDMYPSGTYALSVNSYASIPITESVSAESAPFEIIRLAK